MLNRASRIAAAETKRNPAAHPSRPRGDNPQANDRIAGATPKETRSASESSSTPKSLVAFAIRATAPSRKSTTSAMTMANAALE